MANRKSTKEAPVEYLNIEFKFNAMECFDLSYVPQNKENLTVTFIKQKYIFVMHIPQKQQKTHSQLIQCSQLKKNKNNDIRK